MKGIFQDNKGYYTGIARKQERFVLSESSSNVFGEGREGEQEKEVLTVLCVCVCEWERQSDWGLSTTFSKPIFILVLETNPKMRGEEC